MTLESTTEKLTRLSYDLNKARVAIESRAHKGEYIGVGATVRVPYGNTMRRIGVYANSGADTDTDVELNFFENDRPMLDSRITYRATTRGVVYGQGSSDGAALAMLGRSREFGRRGLYFLNYNIGKIVPKREMTFIDDVFRHAICRATTYDNKGLLIPHKDIRLPIKSFNKRLPRHTNAQRLWLKYRHPYARPEEGILFSGLPYSSTMLEGGEYEGKVAVAIAGDIRSFADVTKYPDGPLVRMHSACSFSEVGRHNIRVDLLERGAARLAGRPPFVSHKDLNEVDRQSESCDCRAQMEESQHRIAEQGGIYADFLEQEGRGYGLLNKEEFFYRLFDEEAADTADICKRYDILPDVRVYENFANWLYAQNIRRVRLLCNNPRKVVALEKAGIHVILSPLWSPSAQSIDYLIVKRDKLGHVFPNDEVLKNLVHNRSRIV